MNEQQYAEPFWVKWRNRRVRCFPIPARVSAYAHRNRAGQKCTHELDTVIIGGKGKAHRAILLSTVCAENVAFVCTPCEHDILPLAFEHLHREVAGR